MRPHLPDSTRRAITANVEARMASTGRSDPDAFMVFPPSDRWFAESGYDPADGLFKHADGSLFPRINSSLAIRAALKTQAKAV